MVDRQTLPENTFLDGSYRIVRVIGAGGFGITYEAVDIKLATRVAIKEYFPLEFGDRDSSQTVRPRSEATSHLFEWGRENFLTEARTLASFDHASIVRVLRVFEANATAYMVMRFEKGHSFEDWLKSLERLPTQRELDAISRPLLDALSELHSVNYLHRDIAPDNIVIRPDGTPVLLDFGSARHVVAEKSRAITGIVKAGYSPQEQYASDNKHQGPWTDIYALGGTLYRAVTGKRPPESMLRFDDASYEPAAVIARGRYRAPFLEAIDKALSVRPIERPQSVEDFREQLFRPEGSPTVIVPRDALQSGAAAGSLGTVWPAGLLTHPKVQKGALAVLIAIGALSALKIAHHLDIIPSALVARQGPVTAVDDAGARAAAAETKRLADLEAVRRESAAKAQAQAERKRLADLEAERQRVEAEKKRAAEAEAARLKAEAEKKRLADLEAERLRVEATAPPMSRQDGGRTSLADPRSGGGGDGGLEEFLASYRELLRSQQCNVTNLTSMQLEKSVPAYVEAVNKLNKAQLEKINFQAASRSTFNMWLEKAHAQKSATCPFDPSGAAPSEPKPKPVAQPVYKAPPAYRPAPSAPRAPQAPSQRTIMGIQ